MNEIKDSVTIISLSWRVNIAFVKHFLEEFITCIQGMFSYQQEINWFMFIACRH